MRHLVSATSLNLRAAPRVAPGNRMATLPQGHSVEKVGEGPAGWWQVTTMVGGARLSGYVASRYVAPAGEMTRAAVSRVVAVHLQEDRRDVTRGVTSGRAFPLGETDRPRRDGRSAAAKVRQLHEIVAYLDVERSPRYLKTPGATYCNIYTYDFCYLGDVYLPRVWWTPRALADLAARRRVVVRYGDTVRELNANALYDWLGDFGADFGWRRVAEADALQDAANDGGIAVICAQRTDLNRSGHICVVVPERPPHAARRLQERVQLPLQSQAGARNSCYSCGTSRWWAGAQFRAFGFWVHE